VSSPVKKASIVSVGNEVLSGRTVDTNAAYIGRQLVLQGLPVVSAYTVADRLEAIVRSFRLAADDADVVIVTGGLGPTDDDVTRQAVARYLGVELELDAQSLARIEGFFQRRGVPMSSKNVIQAHIPKGAQAITNEWGTAPGIAAQKEGKLFFVLPGVPNEMEHIFQASVVPRLGKLAGDQVIAVRRLRCFGAGESTIAEMLGDAMERDRNPLVNCTVGGGVITLEIVAIAASRAQADEMADSEEDSLRRVLGSLVFGEDDQTLAEVVGQRLVELKRTLAVAESCTGGLLAKLITDVPGASRYFTRGWVTYSNEAKTEDLGVSAELIERYGAVSKQVAQAMAQGARRKAGSDYAVGITGIAGPDGGTERKPVGLVYISVDYRDVTETSHYTFPADRCYTRMRAAQTALDMLRTRLSV
jgi:nicotinamide-nucleotide amidase